MFAGAITALIGVFILIGWQINITVFNYSMQGDSPIRANASIAFLLSGISLIILHRHSFATNVLVRFFGLVISLIGIVSLAEALFHIHPVFDNFFTGHSHKSDMFIQEPVYSAINFILIGFSLIFLTLRIKNRFALEFFLILPFSISLMVFLGHLTGLHDLTGIALHFLGNIYHPVSRYNLLVL
jgi:hypothetical protein